MYSISIWIQLVYVFNQEAEEAKEVEAKEEEEHDSRVGVVMVKIRLLY